LRDSISAITGIDLEMLKCGDPERLSVAERMSWAANRTTTRVEDIAYSLLGIFGLICPCCTVKAGGIHPTARRDYEILGRPFYLCMEEHGKWFSRTLSKASR
jgi:hypothetical protein